MRADSASIIASDSSASSSRELAAAQQLDVAAHDRDRRAQLVARVGDEAALLGVGALEAVEHRVERRRRAMPSSSAGPS